MLSQLQEKNSVFPIEKFQCFVQVRNTILLQHCYPFFTILSVKVVAYGRLQSKENFKLSALKVALVTYERWSLSKGANTVI